jgi:hydrogenase maturation protein HypF
VTGARAREQVRVTGVVQGVGFRPFVHRTATALGLSGFVLNDRHGVLAEVEGDARAVDEFARRLVEDAPPRAVVGEVRRRPTAPTGERGFRILASLPAGGDAPRTPVPPDTALCADCRRELFDPADRRYRHPFITCTACGPRFTIVERLPYDRPHTTMASFELCPACRREYDDPADRRYHAQPLCCPACGPRLSLRRSDGSGVDADDDASLRAAVADLWAGRIVAVKGLGGHHLAVRADDPAAVERLRARKRRGDKPFAVMVRDLDVAHRLAHLDDPEVEALDSPAAPIVLVRRRGAPRPGVVVAEQVAPASPLLGLLLPYTGLHHLLLADGPPALVMTSGNLAGEPIVHDDRDACDRLLGDLGDTLLTHDRPIRVPCDDSVVRVVDGAVVPLRRSRGYAPLPVRLPVPVPPTLAVGGDLKAACCLATGRDAWMSQHLGDLQGPAALDALERTVATMSSFHHIDPRRTVADRHPRYLGARWAHRRDPATVAVQHHRAHIASLLAEHGVGPAVAVCGVAFDGTGFGDDGTVWGGEVFAGTVGALRRVGHLAPHRLPGGDAAVRHPARVAVSLLLDAGLALTDDLAPVAALGDDLAVVVRQLEAHSHCVPSSSMGRLFDAVASLTGLRHEVTFEAQAAVDLEAAAASWDGPTPRYRFEVDDTLVASPHDLLREIVTDLRRGVAVAAVAAGFHRAVADLVAVWADRVGLEVVGLSGGVFQNAVLTSAAVRCLRRAGHRVLTHRVVPPNDGGLALGQVLLGALGSPSSAR